MTLIHNKRCKCLLVDDKLDYLCILFYCSNDITLISFSGGDKKSVR
jgi:hypothetical protein